MDDQDISKGVVEPQLLFAVLAFIICCIWSDLLLSKCTDDLIGVLVELLRSVESL